ncbi:MAG: pilus assembly protein PilM [Oxalobacter sp.]|nr:MAG: pilus assembly protein PilM [Oxalobacter sp.]
MVGLDISTSGVRLVELSRNDKGDYTLECYASETLPRGAITDGNIDNIDNVAEAVRRVWRKSGTSARAVVLGMPSGAVITRKILLRAGLTEDEMEAQVESEASQYIPFALDEVNLDFDVIGPSPGSGDDVEVMLAAARREKVEDRVAVAEAAGLKPMVMDIDMHAARAAVARVMLLGSPAADRGQVVALFRIGAQTANFAVLVDRETVYEREQPIGGNQLTQDIVRAYGMSFEEAELKKRSGDLPGDYEQNVLLPFMESIAQEVTRAIQFFFTSSHHTRVDHIFLAGGTAILHGLDEIVASRTRVKTSVVNTFRGMRLSSKIREAQLQQEEPAYLVACGLAMRRFD